MNPDYSQYLIKISSDPVHYGPDCGDAQAVQVAQAVADLVRHRFPGILAHILQPTEFSAQAVLGPDPEVVLGIVEWLNENWYPALLAGSEN